jgi:hypothetical protein
MRQLAAAGPGLHPKRSKKEKKKKSRTKNSLLHGTNGPQHFTSSAQTPRPNQDWRANANEQEVFKAAMPDGR